MISFYRRIALALSLKGAIEEEEKEAPSTLLPREKVPRVLQRSLRTS